MISRRDLAASVRSQTGFTIVEVLVASLLTAVLLGFISSTVVSVASVSGDNNRALRRDSQRRDVLSVVRADLEATSLGTREVLISPDGHSIRFSILLGATQVGAEVSGVWSSSIEIAFDGGEVVRRQDGVRVSLARGLRDLTFSHPPGEPYIEITGVSMHNGRETSRTIRVYPKN